MNLDTPIPSGPSWSLYYHPSDEPKWGLATFINAGSMKTWRDVLILTETLGVDKLSDGMFFLMRDPVPPLWENSKNIYGGAYSFRVPKKEAGQAFVDYAIAAMTKQIMTDPANFVNGMSISSKKTHNIIKIWNTNATTYSSPSDMLVLIPGLRTEDVLYTPFTDKRMS